MAGHSPCTTYNPVNGPAPFRVLVAELVEYPPGVRKVMGSNPTGDSDFFPSLFMCVSTIPLNLIIYLFVYSFIYLFVRSFVCLFVCLFIYLFPTFSNTNLLGNVSKFDTVQNTWPPSCILEKGIYCVNTSQIARKITYISKIDPKLTSRLRTTISLNVLLIFGEKY